MLMFGAFGPLASVKIMWPRNEEKGRNNSNCGFVAFMSRKDGERALKELKNRDDMRIGWGKPVEVPPHPIYIPPELVKLLLPPPCSGLPFNAQPIKQPFEYPKDDQEMKELLYSSVVKVTIPLDKKKLMLIHHTIEFVINEGPMFEAMIMNKEINNPAYQFLFDNKSPAHIYYRWKLYSLLQGESPTYWSVKHFRMFEGGSVWIPPPLPNYTEGMPECLLNNTKIDKKLLSDAQKNRLIQYIQQLTMNRARVGEAMVFCLNHGAAYKDIVEILANSFENESTKATKKIARLYLVSDILYNSGLKKFSLLKFRDEFMKYLPNVFEQLQKCYKKLAATTDQDSFKSKVFKVLRTWDLWKIYEFIYINKLEVIFQGVADAEVADDSGGDEPLDGKNLIKRSLKNGYNCESSATENDCVIVKNDKSAQSKYDYDIQAQPQDLPGFIPSKWETIDPEQLEAQAMSTKKFYDLELEKEAINEAKEAQFSSNSAQEREKLRNVELLVMQYQDELESGKRRLKKGKSLESQLDEYRNKLIYRMRCDRDSSSPDNSPDRKREYAKGRSYNKKTKSNVQRDRQKYTKIY